MKSQDEYTIIIIESMANQNHAIIIVIEIKNIILSIYRGSIFDNFSIYKFSDFIFKRTILDINF